MSNKNVNSGRRRMLVGTVATLASAAFARDLLIGDAQAGDLPQLSLDNPTAKALKYHHDATKAPRMDKGGKPAADQFCKNCNLIRSDAGEWRQCAIFPGKSVNENGWCTAWVLKT